MGTKAGTKEQRTPHINNSPIVRTVSEEMPPPMIDEADSQTTYIGDADLGTKFDAKAWRIKKITKQGTVTTTEYALGTMEFVHSWADRRNLKYSR